MEIDKIITLANSKVRLRFLALERSLRDTGCDLPLLVIPYDDNHFELPKNASWWEVKEITNWLGSHNAHRMMRKYQCLTISNYQFVDSDVIFLSNPYKVLKSVNGFVSSCGHWNSPGHTYTNQSLRYLQQKSTLWQKFVFNAGQFANDTALYSFEDLKAKAESEDFKYTCLNFPYHDQPGLNMLVNISNVAINNLTLPPYNMESTWAGVYNEEGFQSRWTDQNKPYLIHWAGCRMDDGSPVHELFYNYLTKKEKEEWDLELKMKMESERKVQTYFKGAMKKLKNIYHIIKE